MQLVMFSGAGFNYASNDYRHVGGCYRYVCGGTESQIEGVEALSVDNGRRRHDDQSHHCCLYKIRTTCLKRPFNKPLA